jgi:hypothetical protein
MKVKKWIFSGLLVVFALIQFVPYGRDHANPPVLGEPNWDSTGTRDLAKRACFNCHSNETVWPWYSRFAPVSWLVQSDVDEGRHHLNFSDWGRGREGEEPEDISQVLKEGEMPPWFYLPLHPEARLSPTEKEDLRRGLVASAAGSGLSEKHEGHVEGDDDD